MPNSQRIICGDALEELKKLESESVDCCITSPPYFNLRDYGTATWEGGNIGCEHLEPKGTTRGGPKSTLTGGKDLTAHKNYYKDICKKCGAKRIDRQLGLETTYQEFIGKLIEVFNEVKRVLKKEGTCFVNLGDSYSGNKNGNTNEKWQAVNNSSISKKVKDIPEKSLMLIPHRFAISMIDNGYRLRNTIPWIKPNAMPESVQDRWKKAHEYWFFFVKSKKYYFDLDTIRTPHKDVSIKRAEFEQGRNALGMNESSLGDKSKEYGMPRRVVKLNEKGAVPPDYLVVNTNCSEDDTNREHYATYPQKLIYPFVVAGCPKDGVILDPFAGSGTTGVVAKKNNRGFIGIDLSPKYCEMARERLAGVTPPLF